MEVPSYYLNPHHYLKLKDMLVTEQEKASELADFLFKGDGPCFAVAKIGLSEDPWSLPVKDGAAIARRMRIALGIEAA